MSNVSTSHQVLFSLHQRLFRDGDFSAVDDLISDDFVWREHGLLHQPEAGREGVFEFAYELQIAFPDWSWELEPPLATRGLVMQRWTLIGTHEGKLWGHAASGQRVQVRGVHIARVRAGLIRELWQYWDLAGLMAQVRSEVTEHIDVSYGTQTPIGRS